MKVEVRNMVAEDYPQVLSWWRRYDEPEPTLGMLPLDTTFIAMVGEKPVLAVTLYPTNSEIIYVENFVGNPDFEGEGRRFAASELSQWITRWAFEKNFKRMCCLAPNAKLKKRYEELGFRRTLDNVATFVREPREIL